MSTTVTTTAWVELADSTAERVLVTPIIETERLTPRRMFLVEAASKAAAELVDGQRPSTGATKTTYLDTAMNSAFVTDELSTLGNKLFAQAVGLDVEVAINITPA